MSTSSSGRRPAGGASLWLRWSWRDLRARWLQVVAIALVIALGTGSFAGLTSLTRWRRISTDDAYRTLQMYDLRVQLSQGNNMPRGEMLSRARSTSAADSIATMSERLIGQTQVDASNAGRAIMVPGLLYGVDLSGNGRQVNSLFAAEGRALDKTDVSKPVVMLERNFAKYYQLPPEGEVRLSGGETVRYVGQALTPEYFLVITEKGGLLAQANFAAVFASLETAQGLTGKTGLVNDLLLTLKPGANREVVRQALQSAFAPEGTTVTTRDDDPAFRYSDRDIDGDRQISQVFALLIFGGAVGAAFNLAARLVESQRREIGIGMALGLQPTRIAIRPMLVGAQVALLGVLLGLGVGYLIGQALLPLFSDTLPLPAWRSPFQVDLFASVASIGFLLPLLATAWPVWRAVRVPPIETIRPAYRAARGGGLVPLLRGLRLPGNTLQQWPLRNVVRSPRRSLLTALGIGAALAALVGFFGLIDSLLGTSERADREILSQSPQRVEVTLSRLLPERGPEVQSILAAPGVQSGEPGLLVDGLLTKDGQEVGIQLELLNLESSIWRPSLVDGEYYRAARGVYISELAAKDLGLSVGSTVTLRHPQLQASGALTLAETDLPVLGIHPHPFRFIAYMDERQASLFGMAGLANQVTVLPAAGVSSNDLKRQLFSSPGVASIASVGDVAQAIRDLIDEFIVVFRVIQGAMLLIAALIAFNAASIAMDERAREHATMFAFGLPVGTVLRLAVIENFILGVLATALGVAAGWFLLNLAIAAVFADTMPDLYIKPAIAVSTLLVAVLLGVVCVALAPLFTWRRLSRMDVPATLKVME